MYLFFYSTIQGTGTVCTVCIIAVHVIFQCGHASLGPHRGHQPGCAGHQVGPKKYTRKITLLVHYLSRSPNAPKSLDDLRTELDSLAQTVTWSQASLEPLLKVLGRRLARIFTNLMKMMEPIIKFGGGEQVGVDIDIEIFKQILSPGYAGKNEGEKY